MSPAKKRATIRKPTLPPEETPAPDPAPEVAPAAKKPAAEIKVAIAPNLGVDDEGRYLVPIGCVHVEFTVTGLRSGGYYAGGISGRGPDFEFEERPDDYFGVWDTTSAPLGIGADTPDNPEGHYPETYTLTIRDDKSNTVAQIPFEVVEP